MPCHFFTPERSPLPLGHFLPHVSLSLSTATLGPPSVTLVSSGANIEVSIEDPVLRISEFKEIYNHATFNVAYWKEGQEKKVWWPFYFPSGIIHLECNVHCLQPGDLRNGETK